MIAELKKHAWGKRSINAHKKTHKSAKIVRRFVRKIYKSLIFSVYCGA